MTVIACLPTSTTPLLISDMLLSRDRTRQEPADVYLPTLGFLKDVEKQVGASLSFEATRLVRKPFIVDARLHIAWAGNVSAGRALRENLIRLIAEGTAPKEAFSEAIALIDLEGQKALSVMAVLLPGTPDSDGRAGGTSDVLMHGCTVHESPLWGRCIFGGSGAAALLEWIKVREVHWSHNLAGDEQQFIAELICGRLIFAETLMTHGGQGAPYAELLSAGCGGFYEASRFCVEGVRVPRNALHFQFQYSEGVLRLTRLLTYSTGVLSQSSGRQACIWSLVDQPVDLGSRQFDVTVGFPVANCVLCPAFWSTHLGEEPIPIQAIGINPADEWRDTTVVFEVATVAVFEYTDLSLEQIEKHPAEMQMALMEATQGSRNQLYVFPLGENAPWVKLDVQGAELQAQFSGEWLSEIVARFESSRESRHVVIDR